MKKLYLLTVLLCFILISSAQTYVKVADRAEYKKYEAWCKVLVDRHVELNVKIKIQPVNGVYTDTSGNWVASYPIVATPVKYGTVPTMEQSERLISFWTNVKAFRVNPTPAHFYANWEKIKLEYGIK